MANSSAEMTAPQVERAATDNTTQFIGGVPTDQTALRLFEDAHSSALSSIQHNNTDSQMDSAAVQGDKTSVALAGKTNQDIDSLSQYIDHGGNFSDTQGQKLGAQVQGDLRQEHTDHLSDRQGDLQYAGANGTDKATMQLAQGDGTRMSLANALLDKPNVSQKDELQLLGVLGQSADELVNASAHAGPTAGKDMKDIGFDSKIIKGDIDILMTGQISPQESAFLHGDLTSRINLVNNESTDMFFENVYAADDNKAIKTGGDIDAALTGAMHSHSGKAMKGLSELLSAEHSQAGTGTLDQVIRDRQGDIAAEPVYVQANNANNQLNTEMIELTNPYVDASDKKKKP